MAFIQMNFLSESLMPTVNVDVILPVDTTDVTGGPIQEPQPFKTLYLLHGILGSHVDWINGTNIQRWAEEKNLAVVMPAGENSFYLDREETHELYGTYVGRELVELTRKAFPLSRRREDTFIGGLSMGGYGALRNGLLNHDIFSHIVALSVADVAVDAIIDESDNAPFFQKRPYMEGIFGDLSKVKGSDKDIQWIAGELAGKKGSLPAIYLACGTEDELLDRNRRLKNCFEKHGYRLTYVEGPGKHEWDFWDAQIRQAIEWLPLSGNAGMNSGNVF